MPAQDEGNRSAAAKQWWGLAAWVFLCLLVSALGGLVTASSVNDWYTTLHKPPFNPPDWVFAPVWTALYLMMAVAAWRVWRLPGSDLRSRGLWIFGAQLAVNLAWSFLFFGAQRIDLALLDIVLLLALIALNLRLFLQLDRPAGWLLLPYLAWVAFAALLNASLWRLN
jgi:tryptophan-rich sensory protein